MPKFPCVVIETWCLRLAMGAWQTARLLHLLIKSGGVKRTKNRTAPEIRQRAVRMVLDHESHHTSCGAAVGARKRTLPRAAAVEETICKDRIARHSCAE